MNYNTCAVESCNRPHLANMAYCSECFQTMSGIKLDGAKKGAATPDEQSQYIRELNKTLYKMFQPLFDESHQIMIDEGKEMMSIISESTEKLKERSAATPDKRKNDRIVEATVSRTRDAQESIKKEECAGLKYAFAGRSSTISTIPNEEVTALARTKIKRVKSFVHHNSAARQIYGQDGLWNQPLCNSAMASRMNSYGYTQGPIYETRNVQGSDLAYRYDSFECPEIGAKRSATFNIALRNDYHDPEQAFKIINISGTDIDLDKILITAYRINHCDFIINKIPASVGWISTHDVNDSNGIYSRMVSISNNSYSLIKPLLILRFSY